MDEEQNEEFDAETLSQFYDIMEDEDHGYIIVDSGNIVLEILPFYSLPARKITDLYASKRNTDEFIMKLYSLIQLAMSFPENFQEEVYEAPISYEDLFNFLNEWIKVSDLIRKFKNGEIDEQGKPTVREHLRAVDIYEHKMLEALRKGEPVKSRTLIRYLIEHIKRIANDHNAVSDQNDQISTITIEIEPVQGDQYGY
jgi:hypothetical protein